MELTHISPKALCMSLPQARFESLRGRSGDGASLRRGAIDAFSLPEGLLTPNRVPMD